MTNVTVNNLHERAKVSTINDLDHGEFGVLLFLSDGLGGNSSGFLSKSAALQLAERLTEAANMVGRGASNETIDL